MGKHKLQQGLQTRHLMMMSIAGVIGGGLFTGSGNIIKAAGPAVIIAYLIGGTFVMIAMRMLGEMAAANPDTGSFSTYADRAVGRWLGFTIGWLYWFFWSSLMGWEIHVASEIIHQWINSVPVWIISVSLTTTLVFVNFLHVKHYGEFEFWFAIIKVIAIIVFIIIGGLAITHLWPFSDVSGITHLTSNKFMPHGVSGIIVALLGVMFTFMGSEIVTIAATESHFPEKDIIKTTKSVIWRICIFYIGSMFVIVSLVPWNDPKLTIPEYGPFRTTLEYLNVGYAGLIVNIIVCVAVLSCFNSALYTSSRMLFSLSKRGDAPHFLQITNKQGVPFIGVIYSAILSYITIWLGATGKMDVFNSIMQAVGTIGLITYFVIALSQLNLRKKLEKQHNEIHLRVWLFPWLTYAFMIVIISLLVIMYFEGTYRNEVMYSSILSIIIVISGIIAQKFNIGRKNIEKK